MANLSKESMHSGDHGLPAEYLLGVQELFDAGVDLDYFPGAVFVLSKSDLRLLKISEAGARSFGITSEIWKVLLQGRHNDVFFPAGLRRVRPLILQLIESGDHSAVVSSILEYRAHRVPRYVHISLRLMEGKDTLLGLAQYIPPSVWPSNVIQSQARQFRLKMMDRFRLLTAREREVLRLIVYGKTNPEVARKLDISINTVKTHRKNVHVKLDISHQGDIIKYAVAFDLVEF